MGIGNRGTWTVWWVMFSAFAIPTAAGYLRQLAASARRDPRRMLATGALSGLTGLVVAFASWEAMGDRPFSVVALACASAGVVSGGFGLLTQEAGLRVLVAIIQAVAPGSLPTPEAKPAEGKKP